MPTNIVRFDPFEDMARLQREVNRLFDDSGRPTGRGGAELASARTWAPAVDIFEDREEIVVRADLPGLRQEDIDIELTGDTLTLKGERKFQDTPAQGQLRPRRARLRPLPALVHRRRPRPQ